MSKPFNVISSMNKRFSEPFHRYIEILKIKLNKYAEIPPIILKVTINKPLEIGFVFLSVTKVNIIFFDCFIVNLKIIIATLAFVRIIIDYLNRTTQITYK